jgi:hypothetical protein
MRLSKSLKAKKRDKADTANEGDSSSNTLIFVLV